MSTSDRRGWFGAVGGLAFTQMVNECAHLMHRSPFAHYHHPGAHLVLLIAAYVLGFIIGWGCGR